MSSTASSTPLIVNAEWLASNLGKPGLKVFDATSHLPTLGRDANAEHLACRIAGSLRFDIDKVADKSSPLPHTLPAADQFQSQMQDLGLENDDHVIVYCDSVFLSPARAWWMLRLFGHEKVSVLDGGLKSWLARSGATESGAMIDAPKGGFTVRAPVGAQMIPMDSLRQLVELGVAGQIADARSAGRFAGVDPEPRAGLRGGHMPGASNVPIASLINQDGGLRSLDEIAAAFAAGGIETDRPVITTCGSGVTACGLALGLALLGNENVFVYDGS
ncbi:sulfurtransferase, partial [Alphaproteobacteria bacterium]|nr:sulfurtransferase [Alphaproteobacteria bacterium]